MLKSYFTIALRNILRNKTYSFINILGLSIGVACCMLLVLYIQDEVSYDKHNQDLDNLYRITTHFTSDRGIDRLTTTSPPIAMAMAREIPEIVFATRLLNPPGVPQNLIRYGDNVFYEKDGFIADSTLFDVLTYEFLEGNPKRALVIANSVVINDQLARKLFGNEPALDKTISISQGNAMVDYKITGVFKANAKTSMHTNFIVSMTSSGWGEYLRSEEASGEWAGQNFVPSFVRLVEGHKRDEVVKKINEVLVKYGSEDMKALGITKKLDLEPLRDIYLYSDISKSPRIVYIYVVASIAAFILLIACINFMNLSTARATKRAGEIGIRKVMGAVRSSLMRQILGEAMVIVLFSLVISVIIIQVALPFFNQVTGKSISFNTENAAYFAIGLAAIALVTGLIAGSYPAFYLSSFQPAQVLKGKFTMGNASGLLRRSLVVFQFMIAIALVCGMLIISRQMDYIRQKDLGFNANAKIVLPLRTATARNNYEGLKNEILRNPGIVKVSGTDYLPGSRIFSDMLFYTDGGNMNNAIMNFRNDVDYDYMDLLGLKLIAGRSFTENREADSNRKLIVNRTSAKKFGFEPDEMVGKQLHFDWQGEHLSFEVIGVMEDYHQVSLKEEIKPTMFQLPGKANYQFLVANLNTENFNEAIASLEKTWNRIVNDTPFEYSFLDENIQKQYDEDRKISKIISSFTYVAMLISCLGLYGLSMYMAERRFKEIGIRKVMGASVRQVVSLMSKEFVKLVLMAFVISVPLAWYAMNKWLAGFAYKTSIELLVFVYAGLGALGIALLTVSFESIKAASANPVDSLRNE